MQIIKQTIAVATISFCSFINIGQAKPIDPAPMPDEVIKKIHTGLNSSELPLVKEIRVHGQEITGLIAQLKASSKQRGLQATKIGFKTALEAKAFELRELERRLASESNDDLTISEIRSRLNEIAVAFDEMANDHISNERINALEHMMKSPDDPSSVIINTPPGGLKYDQALPIQPKSVTDKKPAYALHQIHSPVLLAALGNSIAADLPALPEATSCGWVAADLADDGRNVKITQEIKDLAKELDYSPVKIMEWMNKEISFEPYYGALKGGQGVLYSKAGGPTDIASLTIALLRASNIPARYVTGFVRVDDNGASETTNGRIQRWLGTKSYTASFFTLVNGRFPGTIINTQAGQGTPDAGVSFNHVWVEACLPYANYRGSRLGSGGERWIPLDPSFRNPEYQPGIANNIDINYASYLAKRTNELPLEHYQTQLRNYLTALTPARSIDEVGYTAIPNQLRFDVLPASLPYKVLNFANWANSLEPDTAILPDNHQYRLAIDVKSAAGTSLGFTQPLYMPGIALERLTLSFKGLDSVTQNKLEAWQLDNTESSAIPSIQVVPSIKIAGTEKYTPNGQNITFASVNNQLNIAIYLDELPADKQKINSTSYTNIAAANMHALQAYAFQGSSRLIAERIENLLGNVRANAQPNSKPDEIEGEFLHIAGLKWMKYVQDDMKKFGEAAGSSGWGGLHIGLTSTQAKVQYTFDVPLGVTRTGYLIDAPGVVSRSIDLITGKTNKLNFLRDAYHASALESYIWQENAHVDAVSTVRGLQFAKEKGIPILENVSVANWSSQAALMKAPLSNSACASAYSQAEIDVLSASYISKGFILKIPQCKINYDGWKGAVYVADGSAVSLGVGMSISGGFNGGYSLPPISTWVNYTPSINSGYNYYSPPPSYKPPTATYIPPAPPAVISAAINYGVSQHTTFAGDPVNLVNGNLYHNERDISIKGRGGFPIVFERSYNSRDAKDGPLGYGWTHSLNQYIIFSTDNPDGKTAADDTDTIVSSIIWVDGTGSQKAIISNSTATSFTTPKGFYFTVSREAGTQRFIITEKNGTKYIFENKPAEVPANEAAVQTGKAKLVSIVDRNGNALNLSYSGNNLTTVTDSLNRALTFSYADQRMTQVTDWTGRKWQYNYDGDGNLTSFKSPRAVAGKQPAVVYSYFSSADGTNLAHMMKSSILPRGNAMQFEYYINGRVFRHYPKNNPEEATTFSYNDFRRETIVTSPNGNVKRHFFDRFGNPESVVEEDGGVTSYTYDCRGTDNSDCPNPYLRLSETDATGLTIQYEYDSVGNQTKTIFPASNTQVIRADFAANTFGQPRRIKDARNNWKVIRYDSKGNITDEIQLKAGMTPAACTTSECTTPASGNIALWTQRQYDAYGNTSLIKRIRDFGTQAGPTLAIDWNDAANGNNGLNAVKFTRTGDKDGDGVLDTPDVGIHSYDNLGRVKAGINEYWQPVAVLEYDEVDRPVKQLDAMGRQVENDFDANGNLIETRLLKSGALVDRTATIYDLSDRAVERFDSAGHSTSHSYDVMGNISSSSNPDGYLTNMGYDGQGRLIEVLDAEGLLTVRDFDVGGRLQSLTDSKGVKLSYSYHNADQGGRLKRTELEPIQGEISGRASEQDYDANGNVIKSRSIGSDSSVREQLSFYDAQNRLIREVSPVMDTESATPNARRQVCRVYSNLGDLTELWIGTTTDTTSQTCNFGDANLKKQVTYLYDDFGHPVRETDGLNRSQNWTYDVYGHVLTHTDAKAQTTRYTYLTNGLVDTRTDHAGAVTRWAYTNLGQVRSVGDQNVTYTYSYDDSHRVISANDSRGNKSLQYSYSAGGLLNSMTDAENRKTDYVYDSVGRLIGQWLPNNDYFGWGYNSRGLLEKSWSDKGIVSTYKWNADGTLQALDNYSKYTPNETGVSATLTNSHSYTYDAFGALRLDSGITSGFSQAYVHCYTRTALGQLKKWYFAPPSTTACTGTPAETYTYDAFANRTQVQLGNNLLYYSHDAAQQLNRIDLFTISGGTPTQQGQLVSYQYDANGSMTRKQTANSQLNLTWDALNRLKTANSTVNATGTGSLTSNQSYLYDPLDRRIAKTILSGAGSSTNYLYDGEDIHAEYASGSWEQPVAITAYAQTDQAIGRFALNEAQVSSTQYLHADAQGSTAVVSQLSATGDLTMEGSVIRDPWGKIITPQALANVLPDFEGRPKDETGLYNFRARYLDINAVFSQSNDRFISRDPTGYAGGLNPYVAFENDPLTYSDPTGTTASMTRGLQGVINQSYFSNISNSLGLSSPSSGYQNLNTVQYRQSPTSSSHNVQTALNVASAIPVVGIPFSLASAALDAHQGRYASAALGVLTAIPFVGTVGSVGRAGVRTADALLDVTRVERGVSKALPNSGSTTVYQSFNSAGQVNYVGITDSFATRAATHFREKGIVIEPIQGLIDISRSDARAVEQMFIEQHGLGKNGGALLNKINSISSTNPIYSTAKDRGTLILNGLE